MLILPDSSANLKNIFVVGDIVVFRSALLDISSTFTRLNPEAKAWIMENIPTTEVLEPSDNYIDGVDLAFSSKEDVAKFNLFWL